MLSNRKLVNGLFAANKSLMKAQGKIKQIRFSRLSKKLTGFGGEVFEHGKIKPPKFNNIREIKKFNKEILGIRKFEVDDFEMADYLTNGFIANIKRLSSKDIGLIKKVKTISNPNMKSLMGYDYKTDTLYIYKETLNVLKSEAAKRGQTISEFMEELGRHQRFGGTTGKYNYLFHELNHAKHAKNSPVFYKLRSLEELEKAGIKDTRLVKEFLEDAELQQIAGKVSSYAKKSPAEFVAETGALLDNGVTLPEDVFSLYRAYFNVGNDVKSVKEFMKKSFGMYYDFIKSKGVTEIDLTTFMKNNGLDIKI